MKPFKEYIKEKNWQADVDTKKEPPKDLFASGSAEDIAKWAKSSHGGDLKGAMDALNFYVNRAGDNLSADRKKVIDKAKDLLQDK